MEFKVTCALGRALQNDPRYHLFPLCLYTLYPLSILSLSSLYPLCPLYPLSILSLSSLYPLSSSLYPLSILPLSSLYHLSPLSVSPVALAPRSLSRGLSHCNPCCQRMASALETRIRQSAFNSDPKPFISAVSTCGATLSGRVCQGPAIRERQGLPLVHFSAEPEPFWSVSRFVSSL